MMIPALMLGGMVLALICVIIIERRRFRKPIKVEIVCGEQLFTQYLTPIDNTIRITIE